MRELGNGIAHFVIGGGLAALVLWNYWFLVPATFVYAWERERGQHRYDLERADSPDIAGLYLVHKPGFFGWLTWHRVFEVIQWTAGAAIVCGAYEIWR